MSKTTVTMNLNTYAITIQKTTYTAPHKTVHQQLQETNRLWFKQFSKQVTQDGITVWLPSYNNFSTQGITYSEKVTQATLYKSMNVILELVQTFAHPFLWPVDPENDPYKIAQVLHDKGWHKTPCSIMIHNLRSIAKYPQYNSLNKHINHNNIRNNDLNDWMNVINDSFGENDKNFTKKYMSVMNNHIINNNNEYLYYAGYYDDTLTTTGMLLRTNDNCGVIINLATHSHYTRKGFATALAISMLNHAQRLHLSHVLVQASNHLELYEKIGFKHAGYVDEYTFIPT